MSSENKQDGFEEGATGVQNKDSTAVDEESVGYLQRLLERFGIHVKKKEEEEEKFPQLLDEVTFDGIAKFMKSEKCKNVVVMAGAGISTSAGIPDFRSPGSGLYDNLQQYNLPYPEAIFELGFFHQNPEPFFKLAKELFPGNFKPTTSHYFIRLLNEKGLLLRHYTQNIDALERLAGVPEEKLVEAHGTSFTAHCLKCRELYKLDWLKREVFADKVPMCAKEDCDGVVKPDIVFFGENLPERFSRLLPQDMPSCDLLIIMGTSLAVHPFASLVDHVPKTTPRLLINREKCGQGSSLSFSLFGVNSGLMFDDPTNYRDVAWLGSCDDGCLALTDLLGWKEELIKLVDDEHKRIDEESKNKNQQMRDEKSESAKKSKDDAQNTASAESKSDEAESNEKGNDECEVKESKEEKPSEIVQNTDLDKKNEK